jgi:acyl-ACP thioesterase
MDNIFRKEYTVGPTDVDCYQTLKPSRMLLFIQDISGLHSEAISYSYEALAQKGIFWAIIRHRVQVTRMPRENETIYMETWPMPTTRVAYPRSTVAFDKDGNELFRSICLWVLMDLNNRSMLIPKNSGVEVMGITTGTELAIPKSLLPKPLSCVHSRQVVYSDLDRNGHMNNARYMDWVDDLMPSAFHKHHPMKDLTLCYINEALEQQRLDLTWELSEEGLMQVDIHRDQEEDPSNYDRIFAAKILYEI